MSRELYERSLASPSAPQSVFPSVIITGDIQMVVTEADVARGLITGSYRIETQSMQEPLQILWDAEGQVLNRQSRTTAITFDLAGVRAGQSVIATVQVQVTDRQVSVVSGMFVQILVTANIPFQKAA